MKFDSPERLLESQLKDLFSAETQLLKALPKMSKASSAEALRDAFEEHRTETQTQLDRLDSIADMLQVRLTGKKCRAMEGLIEESKEAIGMDAPEGIIDLALVAAAQRIEHYEISGYGTASALARYLGRDDVANLLEETLEEESELDERLTQLTVEEILPQFAEEESGEEGEEEEEEEEEGEEEEIEDEFEEDEAEEEEDDEEEEEEESEMTDADEEEGALEDDLMEEEEEEDPAPKSKGRKK